MRLLLYLTILIGFHANAKIEAIRQDGIIKADVESFCSQTGSKWSWLANNAGIEIQHGADHVQIARYNYLISNMHDIYVSDSPVTKDGSHWYIPLASTLKMLGGEFDKKTNEAVLAGSHYSLHLSAPEELARNPLQRYLSDIDNSPIDWQGSEKQALVGEIAYETQKKATALIHTHSKALDKVGNSKLLVLAGHIPGLGTPIQLTQLAAGGSVELAGLEDWSLPKDEKYQRPVRLAILACSKLQRSRNMSDVPESVRSLEAMNSAFIAQDRLLSKVVVKTRSAKQSTSRLRSLVHRFMERNSTSNTGSKQTAQQIALEKHQLTILLRAMSCQLRANAKYAARAAHDGRLAMEPHR